METGHILSGYMINICRSQWPRGLSRRSATARLLILWVRIPPGAWMSCLLWMLRVVRWMSLRQADHSSRTVLPTVLCRYVWSRNLVNEEALAHWGLATKEKKYDQRIPLDTYTPAVYGCSRRASLLSCTEHVYISLPGQSTRLYEW